MVWRREEKVGKRGEEHEAERMRRTAGQEVRVVTSNIRAEDRLPGAGVKPRQRPSMGEA